MKRVSKARKRQVDESKKQLEEILSQLKREKE